MKHSKLASPLLPAFRPPLPGSGDGPGPTRAVLDRIARAQSGDVPARDALIDRFQPMLQHAIARCRPVPGAAGWPPHDDPFWDDLEIEAVLILDELIRNFDPRRGVNPFVYMERKLPPRVEALVRQERRQRKRERRGSELQPEPGDAGGEPAPEELLDRIAEARAWGEGTRATVEESAVLRVTLDGALAALTDEQRAVIALHADGWELPEIAEQLSIPRAACVHRFYRGRAKVREALGKNSRPANST